MTNLQKRILTAFIILPLSLFFIIKGSYFLIFFLIFILFAGFHEIFSSFKRGITIFFKLTLSFFQESPAIRLIIPLVSKKTTKEIISKPSTKKFIKIQKITSRNSKAEVIILFFNSLVMKFFQNFFLYQKIY